LTDTPRRRSQAAAPRRHRSASK